MSYSSLTIRPVGSTDKGVLGSTAVLGEEGAGGVANLRGWSKRAGCP